MVIVLCEVRNNIKAQLYLKEEYAIKKKEETSQL